MLGTRDASNSGQGILLSGLEEALPEHVLEVLSRCAESFQWDFGETGFSLILSVPCRTGTIYRIRANDGGPDLALKVCMAHWTPDHARSAFEVLEVVQGAFASDPYVSAPTPFGWDDRVPSLCMSWAQGSSLRSLLETGQGLLDDGSTWTMEAVARCGRAYGVLHAATVEETDDNTWMKDGKPAVIQTIIRQALARTLSIRAANGSALAVLRGPGSSPQNVVVAANGHITLVDSPRAYRMVSPHRALAKFLVHGYADMAQAGRVTNAQGSRASRLERAFLSGYAETGPACLRRRSDAMLLTLHRIRMASALGTAALRSRQWVPALRLYAHAGRLLLRLASLSPPLALKPEAADPDSCVEPDNHQGL